MAVIETYTVRTRGYGLPDYAQPQPTGQVAVGPVYTSTDVGELAARLKSIDTFDRRGNIIFLDSFEDGILKWEPTGGAGGGIAWEGNHALHGGFCLKLYTNDLEGYSYQIAKRCAYPVLSKIGFEIATQHDHFLSRVHMNIILYDGVLQHFGSVHYDRVSDLCWYRNSGGVYVPLEGTVTTYDDVFNVMKLVIDFTKDEYVRFIINNTAFDMSGIAIQSFGSPVPPYLYMSFAITNNSDNVSTAYVDSAIITQNEPANPVE